MQVLHPSARHVPRLAVPLHGFSLPAKCRRARLLLHSHCSHSSTGRRSLRRNPIVCQAADVAAQASHAHEALQQAGQALVNSLLQTKLAAEELAMQIASGPQLLLSLVQQLLQAVTGGVGLVYATMYRWATGVAAAAATVASQLTGQQSGVSAHRSSDAVCTEVLPPVPLKRSRVEGIRPTYAPDVLLRMDVGHDRNIMTSSSYLAAYGFTGNSSSSGLHPTQQQQQPVVVATHRVQPRTSRTWFKCASEEKQTDELGFANGASSASEDAAAWEDARGSSGSRATPRQSSQQWGQQDLQQQQRQAYVQAVDGRTHSSALTLPQLGWGQLLGLSLAGWLCWRVTRRMAQLAKERRDQTLVTDQLQQQALAEALAQQRARMRRALAPKDSSSTSARAAARAAALAGNEEDEEPLPGLLPPRPDSPSRLPLTGVDDTAMAEFQRFLQGSGFDKVSEDAIWRKGNSEEEQPKGSAEELQRLTENLRQAVKEEDLEQQQREDQEALDRLLHQNQELQELGGELGGARRRRQARLAALGQQQQPGGYDDQLQDAAEQGAAAAAGAVGDEAWPGQGGELDQDMLGSSSFGRRRRAWAGTDEVDEGAADVDMSRADSTMGEAGSSSSSSQQPDSRSGSPDDGHNPFALTAEARQKWEAEDHLYTTPKAKGFGWIKKLTGNKGPQSSSKSSSPPQPRHRKPAMSLADADYEFALPKKGPKGDQGGSSSSSGDDGEGSSGYGSAAAEQDAGPWGSDSGRGSRSGFLRGSSSSRDASSSLEQYDTQTDRIEPSPFSSGSQIVGAGSRGGAGAGPSWRAARLSAAAEADNEQEQPLPEADRRASGASSPNPFAVDAAAAALLAAEDDGDQQQLQPRPRPMRIRK